jgi:rSAM/selenodomain-associated transferase 1
MRPSIAAIIPVWNEAAAIGHVVSGLPRGLVDEIIVVDARSSDGTADIAARAGARVIVEGRPGYGRACASGALGARSEILAFLDGDGSDDPSALPKLLAPLLEGRARLALGARRPVEAGALPAYAALGNTLAAGLISARWNQKITDLPSFKVIRRADLLALGMSEASYGWTLEMIVKAARRGYRIHEVPLDYRRRLGGESKVSGHLGTSIRASKAILSTLARHGIRRSTARPILQARAIVLMAKAPLPGEAKTRLAAEIGPEGAAAVHRAFLEQSTANAGRAIAAGDLLALMCPDRTHADALRRLYPGAHVWAQARTGLMAGISQAFERARALGAGSIVVTETDSPTLPAGHFAAAFEAMERPGPGIVLGPCADGGYYLVGARELTDATARELFEGEQYEGSTICRRTAERAGQLGLWVEFAPEWYDVDTLDDLRRLRSELDGAEDEGQSRLRNLLANIGQPAVLALDNPHVSP